MNHSMNGRLGPALIIAATLTLVMLPVRENWAAKPKDSFPLSYYPMFSATRGATYSSPSLVGWTHDGQRRVIPYTFAGGGGFNEVRRQVRTLIGDKKAQDVCRKVARRLARSQRSEAAGIEKLQVLTATHNLDQYFRGNKQAIRERVHATCPVVREQASVPQPQQESAQ